MSSRIALVTGASRGFGLALARALAGDSWSLVVDARGSEALDEAVRTLSDTTTVVAIAGDVTDPEHRSRLVAAAAGLGGLDLLVNNASVLGPSPQPNLADYPLDVLSTIYDVNVTAPLGLIQEALPLLRSSGGTIVNVTSDAAIENYESWGGYGSSKAALEQISNVLAVEEPQVTVIWFDPGDMNTAMHQEAFPGEDISDRPPPEASVPPLLKILEAGRPSGRYRASAEMDPS
jgi:NAD(P)-dependent dehydrogenase (short-subunit alcohol dehydrogenase family)